MAAPERPAVLEMLCRLTEDEIAFRPDRIPDPMRHADYLLQIEARIAIEDGDILVAAGTTGTPMGVAIYHLETDDPYIVDELQRFVYVSDLYVQPECRRRGMATALLAAVRGRAVALGLKRMKIGSLIGNVAAETTYRRFGFSPYVTKHELRLDDGQP